MKYYPQSSRVILCGSLIAQSILIISNHELAAIWMALVFILIELRQVNDKLRDQTYLDDDPSHTLDVTRPGGPSLKEYVAQQGIKGSFVKGSSEEHKDE